MLKRKHRRRKTTERGEKRRSKTDALSLSNSERQKPHSHGPTKRRRGAGNENVGWEVLESGKSWLRRGSSKLWSPGVCNTGSGGLWVQDKVACETVSIDAGEIASEAVSIKHT